MHKSSALRMKEFVRKYLPPKKNLKILDVGSMDVTKPNSKNDFCNTYKDLFKKNDNWVYKGLDISEGKNVDIIAPDLYDWGVEDEFNVVISGQCLEHVKDTKEWILQVEKALKVDGVVCIIAPWQWPEHKYPVDCWRILPDGMKFLLKDVCGFKLLEVFKKERDCIGIARKVK